MSARRGIQVVALVMLGLFVAGAGAARSKREPAEEVAARSLWPTLDAAWNARDAERFSALFTEDASFSFVDRGQVFEGQLPVRQYFARHFPRFSPDLRHHTRVHEDRLIAPGVVAVDGQVEIQRAAPDAGAAPTLLRTFAIFAVMVEADEGWKIQMLRVYQMPDRPQATAAPAPREEVAGGASIAAGEGKVGSDSR